MENKKVERSWLIRTILFMVGQDVSLLGSSIVQIALIWFVAMKTSSGTWASLLTISSTVPQMLISLFGGAWADRYNRKLLIIVSDALIALATLVLAIFLSLINIDEKSMVVILFVSIIRSFGAGVQSPAVSAIIPQIVPQQHLLRINGINGSIQSIIQFISVPIAGAVLAVGSIVHILMIDIATAVIGIALLLFILIPKHLVSETTEKENVLQNIKSGIQYIFSDQFLRKLMLTFGFFILLSVPSGFMVTLLIQRTFGNNYTYFATNGMIGFAGMALGGILLGAWGGFKNRIKTLFVGLFAYALFSLAVGMTYEFWLFSIFMFGLGFSIPLVQTATTTIIQEKAETEYSGRVFSLLGIMFTGFMPLGMAIFGPLADVIKIQTMIIACGVALLVLAVSTFIPKVFYINGITTTSSQNNSEKGDN
jgi:MFS transporter, DHA3 family, macrolide efflux protein